MRAASIRKQPQPIQDDVEDTEDFYATRMPRSALRYRAIGYIRPYASDKPITSREIRAPLRRSNRHQQHLHSLASKTVALSRPDNSQDASFMAQHRLHLKQTHKKQFSLVAVLVGMAIVVVLIMSIDVLSSWWKVYQDNLNYGYPRTSQLDAVVGHYDSPAHPTHFIFINLKQRIEIIEFPGGDVAHARIFGGITLYGNGQDLTPVTGEIRNEDGRHDLIVHIQNQQIVYINDGNTFHLQM